MHLYFCIFVHFYAFLCIFCQIYALLSQFFCRDLRTFPKIFLNWKAGSADITFRMYAPDLYQLESLSTIKKLQPLKHLVKLRKSSQVMILPDIRKCSNSDQNLVTNRYSCFWSLGPKGSKWAQKCRKWSKICYIDHLGPFGTLLDHIGALASLPC